MMTSKRIDKKRKIDIKEMEKIVKKNSVLLYTDLVGWLYKNHLKVLREYEATKGKMRIAFVGGKNG